MNTSKKAPNLVSVFRVVLKILMVASKKVQSDH